MSGACSAFMGLEPQRWVGDPVDVVTGNHFDVALEFRLPWSFPFAWRRYYSAARSSRSLPLGFGHTHGYDHRLAHVVDGLSYSDPAGRTHTFPLAADARIAITPAGVLERFGHRTYRVNVSGFYPCEFEFHDPSQPARLTRVLRGRAAHTLHYSQQGHLAAIGCAGEVPILVDTDAVGRITALYFEAPDGRREHVAWQAAYDERGDLARIIDPYGSVQSFAYDAQHRMTQRSDRRGYRFLYEYDRDGRCIRSTTEDGVQEVRLRHDAGPGITVVTRANGGDWHYIAEEGRVARSTDPYGGVRTWVYGATGALEREVGPEGETVRVAEVIDDVGTIMIHRPQQPTESMGFLLGDAWFEFIRSRSLPYDALGFDGHGEGVCRYAIRFPFPTDRALAALPRDVVRSLRLAAGPDEGGREGPRFLHKRVHVPARPGRMMHDRFGLLVGHVDPLGGHARWQYDGNGNVVRHTDHAGSVWQYEYASWNLRAREIDPLGNATRYRYSATEMVTQTDDPAGTVTREAHDLRDRRTERHRHGGLRDGYEYDRSNGLTRVLSAGTERVRIEQGAARRPVRIEAAGQQPRDCAYDERGRLTSVREEDGEALEFSYDARGRRMADLRDGIGVRRAYDGPHLSAIAIRDTYVSRFRRDADTGNVAITDPLGGVHRVEVPRGGVVVRRFANGTSELCQFDWNGQCVRKVRFDEHDPRATWVRAYTYSPVGALVRAEDSLHGTSTYEYDGAHRLIRASGRGADRHYTRDAAGNLLAAPGLDEARYVENRLVRADGVSFHYDARHHLAREQGEGVERSYRYDSEDRLVSCRIDGRETRFRYDALGRRVAKVADTGTTEFLWDGDRLAAETSEHACRVYLYTDGTGLTPFAFIDYDGPAADPASGAMRYVFGNQIGCPVRVENEGGVVVWQAEIEPYGAARVDPGAAIEFNLRWPGHYHDTETGLHYNRHRYYSPALCRYIQVDPQDLQGGLNVYAYTHRPLDEVDVDGLVPCPKKPILDPDESDPAFTSAREQADKIAEDMRQAIAAAERNGEMWPGGTTMAAMVVRDNDGNYIVVVTGNTNPAGLPPSVRDAMGGSPVIGWGPDQTDQPYPGGSADRPPSVRVDENDPGWNYPRTNPDGDREPTTHNHAEQRGLRAVDCDDDMAGVAHVAPTRPCCEGCSSAIQTPENQGGWGGSGDNVSDLGRQPGAHGNHWGGG